MGAVYSILTFINFLGFNMVPEPSSPLCLVSSSPECLWFNFFRVNFLSHIRTRLRQSLGFVRAGSLITPWSLYRFSLNLLLQLYSSPLPEEAPGPMPPTCGGIWSLPLLSLSRALCLGELACLSALSAGIQSSAFSTYLGKITTRPLISKIM